jgi:two-component system phosphate regulon sensor histidine kinase PhoR
VNSPWAGELFRTGALVALALVLGLLLGRPALVVALALTLIVLGHARQAWLFLRFLANPMRRPRRLSGYWEEAAYRIYYRNRRARARMRRVLAVTRRFLNSTEALPDAAVVVDARGDIQWFNGTAARLLALKQSDLGRNLPSLLRHPLVQRLLDGELPEDTAEIPSLRDEDAVLEVRVVSFGEDDRLVLARDTTQVQRLLTMRQDFVANVSHELRTPLTVIVGYLEALSDVEDPDAATVHRLLKRLESPTLRMRSLVEELLLLSGWTPPPCRPRRTWIPWTSPPCSGVSSPRRGRCARSGTNSSWMRSPGSGSSASSANSTRPS